MKRQTWDQVDSVYLDNPEDYPWQQFQITRANGRVIGFWDEYHVFQVVLLDPEHNMQPCKSRNTASPVQRWLNDLNQKQALCMQQGFFVEKRTNSEQRPKKISSSYCFAKNKSKSFSFIHHKKQQKRPKQAKIRPVTSFAIQKWRLQPQANDVVIDRSYFV